MRSFDELESAISSLRPDTPEAAATLLGISEEVLEHWVTARGQLPTQEQREGFRLLALHKQGAHKEPSFNACRETCREVAYYYNMLTLQPEHEETTDRIEMMKMISSHLLLFVSGKMQVAELGEFCCSSKPIRLNSTNDSEVNREP
ncbi:MAG: hypothetical protein WBN09_11905 [Woeseiaceae bacterium]